MQRRRLPRRDAALLVAIAAAALLLRAYLPYSRIFPGEYVNFQGDAWYHMRVVDHLVRNFPHRLTSDPYAAPGGQYVAIAPLFDWLVAAVALAAGFGTPTQDRVELVAAFVPPALAALTIIAVYFLGRVVFDRRVGIIAAALLAVMPGHFLERTLLGATDHHAAEALLAIATLLLTATAIQRARLSLAAPLWRAPGAAWLAGISLGAYLLTWTSGAFLVFALTVWVIVQYGLDHLTGISDNALARTFAPLMVSALALVLAFQDPSMFRYQSQVAALAAAAATLAVLEVVRRFLRAAGLPRWSFVPAVLLLAFGGVLSAAVLFPGIVRGLLEDVARLMPGLPQQVVVEAQPLLQLSGRFSILHPWEVFRSDFFIGAAALAFLALRVGRRRDPATTLLFVWSGIVLLATLGQNRFGYYLVPCLALLSAWVCSTVLAWCGLPVDAVDAPSSVSHSRRWWRSDVAVVGVTALAFVPSFNAALATTGRDEGLPREWHAALGWLRANSPEPFGDPDVYYTTLATAVDRRPVPRYSVMNWWDHGYWIIRAGRRVPVANPTQAGAVPAAQFFTATSEREAGAIMDRLNARYVVVGHDLVFWSVPAMKTLVGKFDSLITWSGKPRTDFFEVYFERAADGTFVPVWIFYPDYYRSMLARLYVFGGQAAAPQASSWVMTYRELTAADGRVFKEIVESRQFVSYDQAAAYLKQLGPGRHRIVGRDPMRTCVPIEPLTAYRLQAQAPATGWPVVRIFEYRRSVENAEARIRPPLQ